MKSFTKEEIEKARAYFRSNNFEEVNVTLDNRTFSYFVIPQSIEPKLHISQDNTKQLHSK